MRQYNLLVIAFLCYATTTTICNALPVSNSKQELDVFNIPLSNGKELDVLTLGDESEVNERNKRTIGILRDLFPEISKQVEDQVNKIVAQVLRTLGPTILRTAIQGNARNRPSPADDFDADFDDDDIIKDDNDSTSNSSTSSGTTSSSTSSSTSSGNSEGATRIKVELPTFKPDDDDDDTSSKNSLDNDEDNETKLTGGENLDLNAINQQLEETIRVARQTNLNENALANSINSEAVNDVPSPATNTDQQVSESKAPAIDELNLDALDDVDGDDRNKRQGLFGGGAGGAGGAGSGNFLFDIIRNKTKNVGQKINGKNDNQRIADDNEYGLRNSYRFKFNGNHELEHYDDIQSNKNLYNNNNAYIPNNNYPNIKNSKQNPRFTNNQGLFSGSVQTQGGDQRNNDASSDDADSDEDGDPKPDANGTYTEGIPGPVTRLVVLANRGLANLIQDLILRVAATSERLVNFKARLITALI